jgi:serine/threonine protein kinase
MVLDMTLALEFLHASGFIHQNVKPSKILLRDGNFVLNGFAMTITSSHGVGGTDSYMPPERWSSPEGDIYGLGATAIECLEGFPKEEERPTGQEWHSYLQTRATGRPIASMLASDPKQRPTARGLLDTYFPSSLPSKEWLMTLFPDTPALPDGVPTGLRDINSAGHNKLGIARTKPANYTHQEGKKRKIQQVNREAAEMGEEARMKRGKTVESRP